MHFVQKKKSLGKAELQTSVEPFVTENCGAFLPALNSCWEFTSIQKFNMYGLVRMLNKVKCSTDSTSGTKKKAEFIRPADQ